MKGKISVLTALFMSACLLCGAFSACADSSEKPPPEGVNAYDGKAEELHLTEEWISSPYKVFTCSQEGSSLKVGIEKSQSDNAYSFMYTQVSGDLGDFSYINLKMRAETLGSCVRVRVGSGIDTLEKNLVGWDNDVALTGETETYSLKIKSTCRAGMDVAGIFALYPYFGEQVTYTDYWYIEDIWFSKDLPAGAVWKNENVDTQDDSSETVAGWKNYAWTNYALFDDTANGGEVILKSKATIADWAYIEKSVTPLLTGDEDSLRFVFSNDPYNGGALSSVTRITFILKGDFKDVGYSPEGYKYDVYYEYVIGHYEFDGLSLLEEEQTVEMPLAPALGFLKEHRKDGLRLAVLVESDLNTKGSLDETDLNSTYNYNGRAQMTIKRIECYKDPSYIATGWHSDEWSGYTLSESGGFLSVGFDGAAAWGSIFKEISADGGKNCIRLIFANEALSGGTTSSVTHITFKLRGDVNGRATNEQGVEYDTYYEEIVFRYVFDGKTLLTEDVTLDLPLKDALEKMAGRYENGLKLVAFIESDGDPEAVGLYDGKGKMTIKSTECIVKN